jgi:5S rRNA maturation endonuclease (ribonuclease M5)
MISIGRRGEWLLHCHGGCSTDDILASIGLQMRDLFADDGQPVDQVYEYVDAYGGYMFEVVRTPDKSFYQRRRSGLGEFEFGRGGIDPVLYRLNEVQKANSEGRRIFIVEGEKDVETLRGLGFVATTNPGGANSWKDSLHSTPMRGGHAVVIADQDAAGDEWKNKVERSLRPICQSLVILRLPNPQSIKGFDISDWVANGGDRDKLISLVQAESAHATHDARSQGSMMNMHHDMVPLWGFDDPSPLPWLVEGIIPEGYVSILAADGGVGKSYIALYMAIQLALGQSVLGLRVRRSRVLIVDVELDEDELKRRTLRVLRGIGVDVDDSRLPGQLFYHQPEGAITDVAVASKIEQLIELHDIGFVLLDSLTVAMSADASSQHDVVDIMRRIKGWGTVLAIDHVSNRMAEGNAAFARPFGSTFKRNMARCVLSLAKVDGGGRIMRSNKNNFGGDQKVLTYVLHFDEDKDRVIFEAVDMLDERMIGAANHMRAHEITLLAIRSIHSESESGVGHAQVVAWRAENDQETIAIGTVRNHFTQLKAEGSIEVRDGLAFPTQEFSAANGQTHDSLHSRSLEIVTA